VEGIDYLEKINNFVSLLAESGLILTNSHKQ